MPVLSLAGGEQDRKAGALAGFRMLNVYSEPDATNGVDGLARLQRPGLALWLTVGTGPINAVFQQQGTFGGDYFTVSGSVAYRINSAGAITTLGNVANQRAQIAASASKVIIVNGGRAMVYDGASFRAIVMPDGLPVQSVVFLSGFFLLSVQGSQRVYYMEPGESDPDALAFFEAERYPDNIEALAVNGDQLWLLGNVSEEVWAAVGDIDAPFQPAGAQVYQNGCKSRDAVVQVDNALFYVSNDNNVMLSAGVPQIISKPDVSESIRLSPAQSLRAWTYKLDQHLFFILRTQSFTWVWDALSKQWWHWASWQQGGWRAHLGSGDIAGDSDSGALWRLTPGRSNDDGAAIERVVSAGVEVLSAPIRCDSVALRMSVGVASLTAVQNYPGLWNDLAIWDDNAIWKDDARDQMGTDTAPRLEMRWSDDEGNLWTDWRQTSLGQRGQYRTPVVFRRLGLIRRPGRLFEFRATDDAEVRFSHAAYNEAVN